MAKTMEELLQMNFKQLRDHCKSLDITLKLGETKGSMIKLILAADPPPIGSAEHPIRKEDALKQKLTDTDIYDKPSQNHMNGGKSIAHNTDNDDYKQNTISLVNARKIIKRYCPRRGPMGMTIHPAFSSSFKAKEFAQLSVTQFTNALVQGNEKLLGGINNISSIASMLEFWDDPSNNNGWNLAKQQLNGFTAPPDCETSEKLMFSVFSVPNIIPKLRVIMKIAAIRGEVLELLCFMDTFHESMRDILSNEVYSKIFLSSILISKFRNEDILLQGCEQYKNVIDFLQRISLQPTAKEQFQSKRWDTLKKKGTLVQEIDKKIHFVISDRDFNIIRKKAIQFGSAVEPPMPRVVRAKRDKKEKMDEIKKDIGTIDTKALQNKLQNALKHKLRPRKKESEEEKKMENDDDDMDLSAYNKMLQIGVKMDAVIHEMKTNGISQEIIDRFVYDHGHSKPQKISDSHGAKPPKLSNALLSSINANRANDDVVPTVAAPIPAAAPPPPPGAIPMPVPPVIPAASRAAATRIPEQHDNKGLNWKKAIDRYKMTLNKVGRLKILTHALDLQFHRAALTGDEGKENGNDNDDEKEAKVDFYDECFTFYMAQLNRIENGLKDWIVSSDENAEILNKLEVSYHTRFRPQIFKQLTSSRYVALSEAANAICDTPQDVIGVIWMFVKPFDELIELKFAVDCIHQFFAKDKKQISVHKLPIQSHRGYEPYFLL
eukprot:893559_1